VKRVAAGLLAGCALLTASAAAAPTAARVALLSGVAGSDTVLVAVRGVVADEARAQATWRLFYRACGCLSPWAWTTYEVRSKAPGRLVLFDRQGRRHESDEPCTRFVRFSGAFSGRVYPFFGLAPGDVAGGEWTGEDTLTLTRREGW
jgi:hypothetical protein